MLLITDMDCVRADGPQSTENTCRASNGHPTLYKWSSRTTERASVAAGPFRQAQVTDDQFIQGTLHFVYSGGMKTRL